MISIIDCGMGNIGSVVNMFKHINVKSQVVSTPEDVLRAEKILLPGVGSWDNGINKLNGSGLREALDVAVLQNKTPVLGICLGMQILLESSDEGTQRGLGWIKGKVKKFDFSSIQHLDSKRLRIPHMGWNVVNYDINNSISSGLSDEVRFYFVHGFHAADVAPENVFMTCQYGHEFACGLHRENIWGVQFHPEKSHRFGMTLMKSFADL